jgi:hypothetical protein
MGTGIHIVGAVYHAASRGEALYFYSNQRLLCARHARGMPMQPFTSYDREQGFGSKGCVFCPGGELAGQFAQYRSHKRLCAALDALVQHDPMDH